KAISAETLMDWAEFAAPAVAARAARLLSTLKVAERMRPLFNVTISNVPGPNFPLYSSGARMVAIYPMGPINDGMGLNMTVMSYMGSIFFGLIACRETVPQVQRIADFIGDALAELLKAANAVAGSTGAGSGATPASAGQTPAGQATTPAPVVAAAKPTTKTAPKNGNRA